MMTRSEIALHYAYLKVNGKEYRILTTNFPQLVAGHFTSDLFGFFGLGSGEFWGPRIDGLDDGVSTQEIPDTEYALMLWKDHPRFLGFIDAAPQHKPVVVLRGGPHSLYTLPINWEVYTQLGVRALASETLLTMGRQHLAYPTPQECKDRIDEICRYVRLF